MCSFVVGAEQEFGRLYAGGDDASVLAKLPPPEHQLVPEKANSSILGLVSQPLPSTQQSTPRKVPKELRVEVPTCLLGPLVVVVAAISFSFLNCNQKSTTIRCLPRSISSWHSQRKTLRFVYSTHREAQRERDPTYSNALYRFLRYQTYWRITNAWLKVSIRTIFLWQARLIHFHLLLLQSPLSSYFFGCIGTLLWLHIVCLDDNLNIVPTKGVAADTGHLVKQDRSLWESWKPYPTARALGKQPTLTSSFTWVNGTVSNASLGQQRTTPI